MHVTQATTVAPNSKRHYTKYCIMWPWNLRQGQDVQGQGMKSKDKAGHSQGQGLKIWP